jgi:hypothetical protein
VRPENFGQGGNLRRCRTIIVVSSAGSALVLASFLYRLTTRFAQFVILRLRADIDKDVEILVLRHQLAVLRRQVGKVRTGPADRAVLALLSLCVPKTSSMSCDLRVFVDHAAKAITPTDSELI